MSTSQCAPDPGLADAHAELVETAPPGASKLLKILLIGFAATMTIGLGLASWYVGVRIKAAGSSVSVSTLNTVSRPVPVLQPAATARELYLEVAGLGPKRDASFVKSLEAKGYPARLGSAGNPGDNRILIGPFTERRGLEEARNRLQSAGVLAVESAH